MKRRDEDEFYVREKRRVGFFSLIELLIVMLVLGILIMLAIPLISGARQAANNVKCRSNLKQLHVAIMAYTIGNKGRRFLNIAGSTDLGILIASGYINKDTKLGNCPGSHEEKVGLNSTAYQGGPKLDGTNALLSESINSNTIILEDVSTAHHKAGKNTILLDGSFTQNGEQIPSQTDSVPELTLDPAFPDLAFALPLDSQHSKDESNRLFVVEQAGIIRVFINKKETKQSNVFLDLSKKVISGGERGLLGIAFHPNYKDNGLFFVNYTANKPLRTFISRFQDQIPRRQTRHLIDSELVILEVEQPYANHNGGGIRFGPDGFLYIGMGDGGLANDPT